jgi:exopolysaccharide biosynthesis polyprenyl glycosylphosphotransferase
MYKRKVRWLKHLDFIMGDVFCLLLVYTLAFFVRNGQVPTLMDIYHRQMVVMIAMVSVFVSLFFDSYRDILRRGYYREFRAILQHLSITAGIVLAYVFLYKHEHIYSRIIYITTFTLGGLLIYAFHIWWKSILRKQAMNNQSKPNVLVMASADFVDDFIEGLTNETYVDYRLAGCVLYNQRNQMNEIEGIPVVCDMENIVSYVQKNVVDEILIQPDRIGKDFKNLIQELVRMGITIHVELSKIYGAVFNLSSSSFAGYPVTTISYRDIKLRQLFMKRAIDIVGSIVGMLILGVAFVIVGPIIKFQSKGPIIFAQKRVGRNGHIFKIYKFRSMYIDAEERKRELMEHNKMKGHMFKVDNDPRITPIGRFIRKTSIDELPQFWNVFKGDMSLVGTRPPTLDEFEQYEKHHRIRLSIKSGITGLWQVSGRSDIVDFEEVVKLDEKYIREWNFGLDIKIILKTVVIVFGGNGSI